MEQTKGSLTVVSGFSGAGKGTIMKALLKKYDSYCLSVSCTTRKPRPHEVDGKDYFFISQDEFDARIERGEFLEYARYVDHSYGTPLPWVEEKVKEGRDVLLEIEAQGAAIVKKKRPDTIMLFVVTPNAKTLVQRLTGRGTETKEVIAERLEQATREIDRISSYDMLIVNDDLDAAVERVHNAIQTLKYSPIRQADFLSDFRKDLIGEREKL